jgi:hypothetical protein
LRYQHKELLKWKEGVHQARLISFSWVIRWETWVWYVHLHIVTSRHWCILNIHMYICMYISYTSKVLALTLIPKSYIFFMFPPLCYIHTYIHTIVWVGMGVGSAEIKKVAQVRVPSMYICTIYTEVWGLKAWMIHDLDTGHGKLAQCTTCTL